MSARGAQRDGYPERRLPICERLEDFRKLRRSLQGSVGFVPTMGALHAGHVSLLDRSRAENEHTVLSIFLNPTQFNNPEDLAGYPKTLERDLQLACRAGVSTVLVPRYEDIYADGYRFQVDESVFSRELCGAHRPGHFSGVLTVVMKLLNIVQPDRAYFGEKDYQQFQLIRDMCQAFFMEVEIVPCPTVRESDGLAMSSRNENLDSARREQAGLLNRLIRSLEDDAAVSRALADAGFNVDYVVSRDGRRFAAASVQCRDRSVRLIDNVAIV